MSESGAEHPVDRGVPDEDLPEELQPGDDNPLANPLTEQDDPKPVEELDMFGGREADESEETEGADSSSGEDPEGEPDSGD